MCDGANRFEAFVSILPLVAPGIGAFLILCVLFGWNDFLFASIIGSGGAKTLPVATVELERHHCCHKIYLEWEFTTLPLVLLI